MKTIKELNKTKKRVTKKVITPIFDDVIIKIDQREMKSKTNYLKDTCMVLATVVIIFTVAWLVTLEAGTLKTCYEIWQSVN